MKDVSISSKKGVIALMGSGELTATMVEVHKELLARRPNRPRAIFLDTPAGFQLNVDQISRRAIEYFHTHVQQPMSVVSFKSKETTTEYQAEQAFHVLREADFILIGPGSPTYAVHQWQQTPIPEIVMKRVEDGGCLVAASAAALTVGRFTLPVYEIYKVGDDLHWAEGMDILGHFGFNLVVIPHWNNAEGGTHDTRFCYMGEPRFRKLENLLPDDVTIFGLDEHTACLIDLEREEALIRGIGTVTLRRRGGERIFCRGDRFPLEVLRGGEVGREWKPMTPDSTGLELASDTVAESFWDRVHAIEAAFHFGLEKAEPKETTNALLELDRMIWKAQQDIENEEFISQARDILRELIVLLGVRFQSSPKDETEWLAPLFDGLLELREEFRREKRWREADAIREAMELADIIVEDTKEGPQWRLKSLKEESAIRGGV
jgi:peptidase E